MRSKKDVNIEIGANIRAARERAGYTQEELSEVLNITPNHLSAIERGASGISLEGLRKVCRLLGVSADQIIFGEEPPGDDSARLALQLARVAPELKPQVKKALSAVLAMSEIITGRRAGDSPGSQRETETAAK